MHKHTNTEIVKTMYGEFTCWKDDLITEQLKQYSAHTRNELSMLASIVQEGDCILDIGAHIGTFSIPFSLFNKKLGKIYSLEGNKSNFNLLKENIANNNLQNTIKPINVIAANTPGFYSLKKPLNSNSGMSYFVPDCSSVDAIEAIHVGDWFENETVDRLDFIKIDVEGAEYEVIKSCVDLISKYKPVLYIEICREQLKRFSANYQDIEFSLKKNNYHFFVNKGKRNSCDDSFEIKQINSLSEGGEFFDLLAIQPDDARYPEYIKKNKEQPKMIENLFLSVGAMKAGTTWLYEQLKDHPDIYFTPEKEIHYFANAVGIEKQLNHKNRVIKLKEIMQKTATGNPKFISENVEDISWYAEYARESEISNEWYESLFRFNQDKKFCADFSNLYCQMDENGWENVRKVSKNLKVIYTLRDPLERLWSHYKFHMKWVNREDEALEVGFEHFKELLDKHFFWINAEYVKNYELLKSSLKDDELLVLYFEDFRENPVDMLNSVQKFLGIKETQPNIQNINKKVNKTKSFELPDEWLEYMKFKLERLMKDMKKVGIWHDKWHDTSK